LIAIFLFEITIYLIFNPLTSHIDLDNLIFPLCRRTKSSCCSCIRFQGHSMGQLLYLHAHPHSHRCPDAGCW